MSDPDLVASLIHGLETRFLLITYSWCTDLQYEGFRSYGREPDADEERMLKGLGAHESQRIRSEFLFAWLLQIENIAKSSQDGIVHLRGFDDALTYISGQTIYELFSTGAVRGPYLLPWDNATSFIENVLKPVASLMRGYEQDESMKIPPEAVKLLELRGLKVQP